ncbi:very long-chain acyl-CoA synthetase-like [Stegastes partitus]|uniref:Long-chain-fatty-acid--CoA ligase n=1 Tax=Stegastes partitus TaxID=144197 RepID=A0A9Y4K690_9TELE|nr:PREDICTED: very long-chain acyl-CoA synthetase-like [Stegastes partitus]
MLLWFGCAAAVLLLGFLFRHPYFLQDVKYLLTKLNQRRRVWKFLQTNYLILDKFLERVQEQPQKPFIRFKEETFTYQHADVQSNKAARVFLQSEAVQKGDTVALFLQNEPLFLWLFLSLVKIGCSAAFLNYNIRSKSLLHCFNCSGAKTLVAAEELQDAVEEVLPSLLEQQVTVFILTDKCKLEGVQSFKDKMKQASSEPLPKELRSHLTLRSAAAYIYTSGTTGLPKAAVVSHGKLWVYGLIMALSGVTSEDVIYNSLPLYHGAGFIGVMGAIERGVTVVLRSKFSASQFWDDCRKYDITVVQYIGETMRYLCNQPQKLSDRNHKVRLALGNGLRADVWKNFLRRFGDVDIKEFYGATEGNLAFLNYSRKMGAVGRDNFLHKWCFPYALIKYNVEKGEPVRDSSGFCIEAAIGESGLLVSKISVTAPFAGYAGDLQQTEKKKLHDVFKKGDMYFNTGDLLRIDKEGFIYFQDRTGDTFRFSGHEGRIGMAAVTLREGQKFDSAAVFNQVRSFLPTYARPCFIRIQDSMDVTGTFKQLKVRLVKEGFNPNEIKDPLYFLDEKEKNYVPLTPDTFDLVITGKLKI